MIKRIMQWTSLVKRQIISAVYVYTECNKKTLQYLEVNKKKKIIQINNLFLQNRCTHNMVFFSRFSK